jgi:hypothetical protein
VIADDAGFAAHVTVNKYAVVPQTAVAECLQHNLTHVAMPASGAVTTGCLLTV